MRGQPFEASSNPEGREKIEDAIRKTIIMAQRVSKATGTCSNLAVLGWLKENIVIFSKH